MSFTVLPAVDIVDGRCVRPLQGRFGAETVYSDDPVNVARGFSAAGARWLHIVDLDGARSGRAENREVLLEVVRRASCPVQAGGGVRTSDDVEEFLAAGANRVVLGASALDDEDEVHRACARYGERIAVCLDARRQSSEPAWTVGDGVPLMDAVSLFEAAGASSFVYTDVGRDGTMRGPDLDGLGRLTRQTTLPVIASGGVASLEDLRAVARLHRDGVRGAVIGRALYEHKFALGEANLAADEAASGKVRQDLYP